MSKPIDIEVRWEVIEVAREIYFHTNWKQVNPKDNFEYCIHQAEQIIEIQKEYVYGDRNE